MTILYVFDSFQSGVEYRPDGEVDQADIEAFERYTLGSVTRLYCFEDAGNGLEQALDDVHVHAVILARAHRHYLNLDADTAQHVGAIIRACRRALPRLANVSAESEKAVRALPPDEAHLLELYRRRRAVDGGRIGVVRRTWHAVRHYDLDLAIEEGEAALADEKRRS